MKVVALVIPLLALATGASAQELATEEDSQEPSHDGLESRHVAVS
jgi:hypothetical protein